MFHLISFSPYFIVHVSSHIRQFTLHGSCFISFPWVHTSLVMFHFYFLQSTVHLIHFTCHSPFCLCLPYLVVFILHGHSTSLSVSLFSQSRLWKLTTYEKLNFGGFTTPCLFILNKKYNKQGLIMLLCWHQICAFQLLLFWYIIPSTFRLQTENFPQFFSNEVCNSVAFFLWIIARVSRL